MFEAVSADGQLRHSNTDQRSKRWVPSVSLAVAVGVAYLLVAWMSIVLMITPVYSFFWPAAGVAAGVLIALGPRARWPVAAGVLVAEVMLKVLKYEGFANAFASTLGNTAEPLIVAGLLERLVRANFRLGRLGHLFGFFAAVAIWSARKAWG
jgi:integral membrane sensor domain MASE1